MSDWSVVEEPKAATPSDWTVVPDAAAAPTTTPEQRAVQPPADDRGFLTRAWDSVAGGIHAIGHVGKEVGEGALRGFAENPFNPMAGVVKGGAEVLQDPAKRRQLERGVDDVVTLGHGQKIAAAAENTGLGQAANQALGVTDGGLSPDQSAQDAEEQPEYRTYGQLLGSAVPNPVGKFAGAIGKKVVSPLAGAFEKAVGSKIVNAASRIPMAGPALAAGTKLAGGAAQGIAGYELAAPAAAALSAGAEGHRLEAARQAATDPAGLLLGGGAGAAPVAKNIAGKAIGSVADAAAKRVKGREFSDLGNKATKTMRDAIDARAPDVSAAIDEYGLGEIAEHPDKLAEKSGKILSAEQAKLSAAHREVGDADAARFIANLEDAKKQFAASDPATEKIQRQIDAIKEQNLPPAPKPKSEGKSLLAEITDGATSKQKERIGIKPDDTLAVAKKFGLDAVADKPSTFQAEAHKALSEVGGEIGKVYDSAKSGPDAAKYVGELEALASRYQRNAQGAEAAAVRKHIEDFRSAFGNPEYSKPVPNPEYAQLRDEYKVPVAKIPADIPEFIGGDAREFRPISAKEFREYKTPLQKRGFAAGVLDPSASASLSRKIAKTASNALDAHLGKLAAEDQGFASEHARLSELNRQYGALKNLADIADRRAASAALVPPEAPSPHPRTGKISVAELVKIAENHEPFNFAKRQFADPTTPAGKVNAAISGAAKSTVSETAGNRAPEIESLQRKVDALRLINEAAAYKSRALRYPTTGLRDVFDKSHRVLGSKILGRAVGAAEDRALEMVRPIDRKLATMSPARTKATAAIVHAAASGNPIADAIERAVAAGIPAEVAQRIAAISRNAFATKREDRPDAITEATP